MRFSKESRMRKVVAVCLVMFCSLLYSVAVYAKDSAPKKKSPTKKSFVSKALYDHLSPLAKEESTTFAKLREGGKKLSFAGAKESSFVGNLRLLSGRVGELYLIREVTGKVYLLSLPEKASALQKGAKGPYANLRAKIKHKMTFFVKTKKTTIAGLEVMFAKLTKPPKRELLDRLFFIAIILLLFLTMVGMGMTLTGNDFAQILRNPKGMIVGPICQFGLLPLIAVGIGYLFGFYKSYPFIFVGMILVCASPGGVTSNLMTYFAKGDVALSVSLTALSTILSLVLTPLLLTLYASNVPSVSIPVGTVFTQILVLVIVPLFVGMLVRNRAEAFALRTEKIFAGIGVFALFFLIVVGVLGNLDKFADTSRYGLKFYLAIFIMTLCGMFFGALFAKLLQLPNQQVRAISLETGLQNSSLAMTIALLLQDRMGDFYSSMFFTSGIFGLWMYIAGFLSIFVYRSLLPVSDEG
ncbi:MAG TPA: hypothetical protein DCE42_09530 [Myxococcales bacterium]|nr:hypothetical protein [Myxococcales bacterium]